MTVRACRLRFVLLSLLVGFIGTDATLAQPPESKDSSEVEAKQRAKEVEETATAEIEKIRMTLGDDELPCVATEKPVLRWTNPTNGSVFGVNHLWLCQGRPVAAASMYRFYDDRNASHMELVSLTDQAIETTRVEESIWKAPAESIEFRPIPEAPAPATSSRARYFQMRALARTFSGEIATRYDENDLSGLRLMPKPLHEYVATGDLPAEGAVFAFVSTTDPEILLLIESRGDDNGRKWYFAAARMHFARVRLTHRGEEIWNAPQAAPPWPNVRKIDALYRILNWGE